VVSYGQGTAGGRKPLVTWSLTGSVLVVLAARLKEEL
jgi:hypothetical protein